MNAPADSVGEDSQVLSAAPDDLVRDPAASVTLPRLVLRIDPKYPTRARRGRIHGTVVLLGEIWKDGSARKVRVVENAGFGFDKAAVRAVKRWKFAPGETDGRPVRFESQI